MKLAPSILSADFANLERDIRLVEELGADYIMVLVSFGSLPLYLL
jgi:ribulose-phosphate 3-epimerase